MAPKTAPKKVKSVDPEIVETKSTDIYRGCLDGLVTHLKFIGLSKHIVELRKTPFKHLFEAINNGLLKASFCGRTNTTIEKILKNYEKETTSLRIGGKKIQITEELIRLIFGIVDGDVEIQIGKKVKERPDVEFIDRLYPRNKEANYKLTKSTIEKQLKVEEITSNDFARLAVLYVLAYALAPTTGYSIGWYYTQFVADVGRMCKYNWSMFIYDMLMAGINKEGKGTMGCVLILAYCLCECTRIITPLYPSAVPRCVKWDLKKLTKALKDKDIEDFVHKVKDYTGKTEEEKRLLHLSHIEEDEENGYNANEPVREEEQQRSSKQEIEKLKLEINKLKRKNKQLVMEINKLKHEAGKRAKLTEQLKYENKNVVKDELDDDGYGDKKGGKAMKTELGRVGDGEEGKIAILGFQKLGEKGDEKGIVNARSTSLKKEELLGDVAESSGKER